MKQSPRGALGRRQRNNAYPFSPPFPAPPWTSPLARACNPQVAPPHPPQPGPLCCLHGNHWSGNLPVYPPASGVARPSLWQQPRESCPSRETAQNLSLPSPSLCWMRMAGWGEGEAEDRVGDAQLVGLRVLGFAAGTALCASSQALRVDRRPALDCSSPTLGWGPPGRGCSLLPGLAQPSLLPAGPALLLGLPKTSLQSQRLPANPMAAPPQLSSRPAPLPSPTAAPAATANCRPVPFQALTPNRPSKTPLPNASPFLPEPPPPHPQAGHQGPAFQTYPPDRSWATPAMCPGGAGVRGQGQRAGVEVGANRVRTGQHSCGGGGQGQSTAPVSAAQPGWHRVGGSQGHSRASCGL